MKRFLVFLLVVFNLGLAAKTVQSAKAASLAGEGTIFLPTIMNTTESVNASALINPKPVLKTITPQSVQVGSPALTIKLTGSGFASGSKVFCGATKLASSYVSRTTLKATVPVSLLTSASEMKIKVVNPIPGGGTSALLNFTVNNPQPLLNVLSPQSVEAGSSDQALAVTGAGFVAGSQVYWGSTALTTSFVNDTTLSAVIPADLLTSAGEVNITVANSLPGGGISAAMVFTVEEKSSVLSELPVSFPLQSQEMVDYFNQIARPNDAGSIVFGNRWLLPKVINGQAVIAFNSWATAEKELPAFVGQVGIVAYNPEHWDYTPLVEQNNLPATVQRAAEYAHNLGFQLMVVPDRQFVNEHLGDIVAYVDYIGFQGQRIQEDPLVFEQWMDEKIQIARSVNSSAKIFVQVGTTQGSASQMYDAIQTVQFRIDGIMVWTDAATFSTLKEFMAIIRP